MNSALVYIGADHAGFQLKERLKLFLTNEGYTVHDMGNDAFEQTDDYPDFAQKVGEAVAKGRSARGILCCSNGVGMCIAANKIPGVRAALANNERIVREAVTDDDINVLCLGQNHVGMKEAETLVKTFLEITFSAEERHKRRVKKIQALELRQQKSNQETT